VTKITPELSDTYVNVPLLVDDAIGTYGADVIANDELDTPAPVIVGVPLVTVNTAEISIS
jgi:hypothetical protein